MAIEYYAYVSYIFMIWGIGNFISLLYTTAPYGRYIREGWGWFVNAKVAWFLQECPSLFIPVYMVSGYDVKSKRDIPGLIMIGLFIFHYFHRTMLYPLRLRASKPIPMIPFVLAFLFCTMNGYLQAGYLLHHSIVVPDTLFVIGISMFVIGMFINVHSDSVLISLRKNGQRGYSVPEGGMFEYVSGANFLGEILEWVGFAVACRTLPSLAFALFTCCNIGPRAFHHHRFYLQTFNDYPKNRKALIPYIL